MSLTPEEQRELAIECGAWHLSKAYSVNDEELAAYTAAVEANEREKVIECIAKNQIFTDDLIMLNHLIRSMG